MPQFISLSLLSGEEAGYFALTQAGALNKNLINSLLFVFNGAPSVEML